MAKKCSLGKSCGSACVHGGYACRKELTAKANQILEELRAEAASSAPKKFKKVHTLAQIKADPRVESISDERGLDGWGGNDGVWVYLKKPYVNTASGTETIHEWKIRDVSDIMNNEVREDPDYWTAHEAGLA